MNMVASVSGAWEAFATKVGAFLPNFFYALFIIIAGWILCNIVKRLVIRLLRIFRFDWLVERAGIARALELGGIKQNGSEILGLLVFWFLFLIVIVATLEILGLTGATETLNAIFLYIPKVVAAVVVLILGLYFANFLQTVTRTSFINAGLKQAESMASITYYATVVFIVAAILQILDIAAEIVMWAFVLIFGSICLALAIALGLGGKDVAARLLEKWVEGPKEH
jgi:Mechanosensitive ion channel, conserved TM helix